MKILIISSIVWNFNKARPQELTMSLARLGNNCVYIEPIKYTEKDENNISIRLKDISNNYIPESIKVVERSSKLRKTFFFLIYENFVNIFLLKKYKPDAIISNDCLMSIPLCIMCRIKKVPFIFDNLDDWVNLEKNKFIRFMLKYLILPVLYSFSTATTNTSHMLLKKSKSFNKNSFLVPNGVSVESIQEFDKYTNYNNGNIVHFVATLRDWYDFDLMFDVFGQFPDLELHIHGKGPLYDYLVDKSKLYTNIHIMGYLDSSLFHKTVAQSLFGILPLKLNEMNYSTSPVKLFDCWAAKKAIIASPTYELKQIGNGCVLFAENKEEYIKNIKLLLNDAILRNNLGEKGYNRVKKIYNYEKIGENFKDIIRSK
ncbi:MAG: glycosyltransferase [Methanosarcinales archaeon]|nr:glycosyltransferase [Methanosarcinales archaeon]